MHKTVIAVRARWFHSELGDSELQPATVSMAILMSPDLPMNVNVYSSDDL